MSRPQVEDPRGNTSDERDRPRRRRRPAAVTLDLENRPQRTPVSSRDDDGADRDDLEALRYRRDLCARTIATLTRGDDGVESLATRAARDVLAAVEAEIRRRGTPVDPDARRA
jgi:hypothetical protein